MAIRIVVFMFCSQIQYVDLQLPESSGGDAGTVPPKRQSAGSGTTSAGTEYKEIDFVKTQALATVRKSLDLERETGEKSKHG